MNVSFPWRAWSLQRFAPLAVFSALYLFLSLLLRLVLWFQFGREAGVGAVELLRLLGAGAVNDQVTLLYVLAPLTLFLWLLPPRLARHRWHRRLFAAASWLLLFGMLYLAAAEYFFFDEFNARFNLVAVDYLIYPHEVLINIWETYPVLPFLLAAAGAAALLLRLSWPALTPWMEAPSRFTERSRTAAVHLLLLVLVATGFDTDTLARSENRVANELSINGISSLFRAFRTNELSYDVYYRSLDPLHAYAVLRDHYAGSGGHLFGADSRDLSRTVPADPTGLGRMNVVVIVEESFGAGFVGAYGDTRGLTPNFDRLAKEGLLFRNTYATGTRTVRGLEAITCSFPPIPSESIVKRPGSENVANWGRVMRDHGYHTSFLYGGFGYFDNMNPFFSSNGFAISDRRDIPDPSFSNIWGVSDQDLFAHAISYFDRLHDSGQPFFSIIMTTSNHTPYTFPEGIEGVKPEGGGRKAGIRYADHALGTFFDRAPEHPWFADTLFVIVADHDARVYGRDQIPINRYRIPLLIYAPGRVEPEVVENRTSQIDIAPTVLGMLGFSWSAPFYGVDVRRLGPGDAHPLLLQHNHNVALWQEDAVVVLGLNRAVATYRYDQERDRLDPTVANSSLIDLATAFYQTAFDQFTSGRYR